MSVKSSTLLSTVKGPAAITSLPIKSASRETQKLDARLQYISEKILPRSPYLLSIKSDRPYQLSSHQADEWRRGSPFAANEERLQYLTFLNRESDDSLLSVEGGWDNEKGEIMETSSLQSQNGRSGTSTPQLGPVQKKKISLSDYKNKTASQTGAKAITKSNGEQYKQNETKKPPTIVVEPVKPELHLMGHNQKRSAQDMDEAPSMTIFASKKEAEPPLKKARTSPPPNKVIEKPVVTKPETGTKSKTAILPPLLSPMLPRTIEEELAKFSKLSALAPGKMEHKKSASVTSTTSNKQSISSQISSPSAPRGLKPTKHDTTKSESNSSTVKLATSINVTKQQELSGRFGTSTSQHMNHSVGDNLAKVNGITDAVTQFEDVGSGARKSPAILPKAASSSRVDEVETRSKLVKLKIPKARRKNVSRILQMKPSPKKMDAVSGPDRKETAATSESNLSKKDNVSNLDSDRQKERTKTNEESGKFQNGRKAILQSERQEHKKPNEKRRRVEDNPKTVEPPSKRQKPPTGLDLHQKSCTPVPPAFKSPALSQHGSAQKPQVSTPKRDIKSAAMRRMESGEGEAKTPQGLGRVETPVAPNSAEKANREGRSASNTSSITSSISGAIESASAWKAEQNRFLKLGRTLKHDADAIFRVPGMAFDKHAIAMAVETILSYMIAFTASDESSRMGGRDRDTGGWPSLLGYIKYVKAATLHHVHMHGLCLQLEGVVRNEILFMDMKRLDTENPPVGPAEEIKPPTPGTEHDGAPHEGAAKAIRHRKDYIEFKTKLIENARLAQAVWTEGAFELSVEDLQRSFPDTWTNNARAPVVRSKEKLMLGKYGGEYYLPLSSVSTGLEAARAGWSLLGEWCKKENVEWEGMLGL